MAVDDYFESEVGIAVAATAALLSPKARRYLRRGAVYAVAGVLAAGEAVAGAARRIGSDSEAATSSGGGQPRRAPRSGSRRPAGSRRKAETAAS